VDETNGYLVKYFIQYNKNKGKLRGHEVSDIFMQILRDEGLVPPIPIPRNPRPADEIAVKFEKTETEEYDFDAPVSTMSFLDKDIGIDGEGAEAAAGSAVPQQAAPEGAADAPASHASEAELPREEKPKALEEEEEDFE